MKFDCSEITHIKELIVDCFNHIIQNDKIISAKMSSLNVLITGTSKGLGHDLVKIFAKKHPNSVIFATSRDKIKRP